MIDVSDGLIQDLGHIASASAVAINVETARLEAPPALAAVARALGLDPVAAPMTWMLTGGEDHALAATFPAGTRLPPGWAVIGQVRKGRGMRVDTKTYRGNTGWSHFR